MSECSILLPEDRVSFYPGDTMTGTVSWNLDEPPRVVELRLFWRTEGKGDQDLEIAGVVRYENPSQRDEEAFEFALPDGPCSFSGKLISLIWALELVALPSEETERLEFFMSPTGEEILLGGGSAE
jgi:hypothetical protein